MAFRQCGVKAECESCLAGLVVAERWLQAIRTQRRQTAQQLPLFQDGRILQEAEQQDLVVSFKADCVARACVIDQPVDHGSRIGSSIHVVAKKYLPGLRRRLAREMPIYSLNNAVQERGASMHVTNHV